MLYTTPTPLEEAYASYLLQHYCFTSHGFPISGREAVVFLTKSNLPRTLLRECWNVVDPAGDGKLYHPTQWWTLLKLVALAQQQHQTTATTTIDIHVLHANLYTPCALAVFDNVVLPQELLQQINPQVPSLDVSEPTSSVVPVDFNAPREVVSLDLALDALGAFQDAPLPPLNVAVAQLPQEANNHDNDDEFGDFVAPVNVANHRSAVSTLEDGPPVQDAPPLQESVWQLETTTVDLKDFNAPKEIVSLELASDALGPIEDAPLPSLSAPVQPRKVDEKDDDDEFGDFLAPSDAPTQAVSLTLALNGPAQDAPLPLKEAIASLENTTDELQGFNAPKEILSLESALDALGAFQDAPLPSLNAAVQPDVDENDNDDEFGDFEAPEDAAAPADLLALALVVQPKEAPLQQASPPLENTTDELKGFNAPREMLSLESALDALGIIEDAQLSSLNAPVQQQVEERNDDDDFGDFEAPVETVKQPLALDSLGPPMASDLQPLEDESAKGFGDFNEPKELLSLDAALASLGRFEDAPLPFLNAAAPTQVEDNDDADEFGEFKAPEVSGTPDDDDLFASALGPHDSSVHDAPRNTAKSLHEENANDYGDFNEQKELTSLECALEAFGPIQDAPLPSSDSFVQQQTEEEQVDDDDEFGDFENVPATESNVTVPEDRAEDDFGCCDGRNVTLSLSDPLSTAIGTFGPVQDAPLPKLSSTPEHESQENKTDNFGDASEPNNTTPSDDPFSSAFDALGPVFVDVRLPSLGLQTQETVPHQIEEDDDDAFGGFEAPEVPPRVSEDDGNGVFGNFEEPDKEVKLKMAASLSNDFPTPETQRVETGLHQAHNYDSNEVGDFEAPLEAAEADATVDDSDHPLSSAFNALALVQDAPLPSLVQDDVAQDHDYDGGSFADFENAPSAELMPDVGALSAELDTPLDSSAAARTNDDPLASAFDVLALVEDSTLRSLGMHKVVAENVTANENDGWDEFGEFGVSIAEPPQIVHEVAEETDDSPVDDRATVEFDKGEPVRAESTDIAAAPEYIDQFSCALDEIAPVRYNPLPALGLAMVANQDTEPDLQSKAGNIIDAPEQESQNIDVNLNPSTISDDDDFGDFEDAVENTVNGNEAEESNVLLAKDFTERAFDGGEAATTELPGVDKSDDSFSAFGKQFDAPLPSFHTVSSSGFSGFESVPEDVISEEKKGDTDVSCGADEIFGDFAGPHKSRETPTAPLAVCTVDVLGELGHDWFGDFTTIGALPDMAGGFDADWGDFEELIISTAANERGENETATETPAQPDERLFNDICPEMSQEDGFGDFDSCQELMHNIENEETIEEIVSRIKEMQKRLKFPSSSGVHTDFVKSFEENVQGCNPSGWRIGFNKNANMVRN